MSVISENNSAVEFSASESERGSDHLRDESLISSASLKGRKVRLSVASDFTLEHDSKLLSERAIDFESQLFVACERLSNLENQLQEMLEKHARIQAIVNFYLDSELKSVSTSSSCCCSRKTGERNLEGVSIMSSLLKANEIKLSTPIKDINSDFAVYIALKIELEILTEFQLRTSEQIKLEFEHIRHSFEELIDSLFENYNSGEMKIVDLFPSELVWSSQDWRVVCSFLNRDSNTQIDLRKFSATAKEVLEDYFETKQQSLNLARKCIQKKEETKEMIKKKQEKQDQQELVLKLTRQDDSPKLNSYRTTLEKEFKTHRISIETLNERAEGLEREAFEQIRLHFVSLKARIQAKKPSV
jgi:hypothetical protein